VPFYRIWQPLPSKKFNIFLTAWSAFQGGKKTRKTKAHKIDNSVAAAKKRHR